jgi:hypothetical protein
MVAQPCITERPAHLLRERFRTTIRFIALFMITAWRARNPNTPISSGRGMLVTAVITAGLIIWRDRASGPAWHTVTAGLLFALMIAWSGHDDVLIGVAIVLLVVMLALGITDGGDSYRHSVTYCEQPMGLRHTVSPVPLRPLRFFSVGCEEGLRGFPKRGQPDVAVGVPIVFFQHSYGDLAYPPCSHSTDGFRLAGAHQRWSTWTGFRPHSSGYQPGIAGSNRTVSPASWSCSVAASMMARFMPQTQIGVVAGQHVEVGRWGRLAGGRDLDRGGRFRRCAGHRRRRPGRLVAGPRLQARRSACRHCPGPATASNRGTRLAWSRVSQDPPRLRDCP